jgi:hypothetical protein
MTIYRVTYIGNPYTRHTFHGSRDFNVLEDAEIFATYHHGTIAVIVK